MKDTVKIYIASSWKNKYHDDVVKQLRALGFIVLNYRENGFDWRDVVDTKDIPNKDIGTILAHPLVSKAYAHDMNLIGTCDIAVLLLPSGKSAHFEFGLALGMGKYGAILSMENIELEIMYKASEEICCGVDELVRYIQVMVI